MTPLRTDLLSAMDREKLKALSRDELEELAWHLVEVARSLASRVQENSTNSSRPPSSDDPYRRGERRTERSTGKRDDEPDGGASSAGPTQKKPAGKQPGMRGFWRQQPVVVSGTVDHDPPACAACGAALSAAKRCRQESAHHVYELERDAMALQVSALTHRYFVARCGCGHETVARPGTGWSSVIEGRRRNLQLSERCLVGPALATFIAALALRS